MNPFSTYFPSLKNEKIVNLFKDWNDVAFSKVMQVGRYTNVASAYAKIAELVQLWVLKNLSLGNSKFITVKVKK